MAIHEVEEEEELRRLARVHDRQVPRHFDDLAITEGGVRFEDARDLQFRDAEAATVDMAGALAVADFKPFVSTFAPFAVLGAAESRKLTLGLRWHRRPDVGHTPAPIAHLTDEPRVRCVRWQT